ncbi:UNVERIFIED_CONTAM: hypothetical protein PYX00_008034 [Menopon gallinae]|uniref:PPM-type phosphatase domain-containing protein n=1 Tax=Menopon gallinae TaxID=328185 RepID=A0AAW2HLI0_9NEOP
MFAKFKNALISAVGGDEHDEFGSQKQKKNFRYEYSRPFFLKFSEEEINAVSDIRVRPLILPRDVEFPFKSGYCECINAGKSKQNEDQGAFWRRTITPKWWTKKQGAEKPADNIATEMAFEDGLQKSEDEELRPKPRDPSLTYTVFAIFDGHGGPMVAVIASKEMEGILHEKLSSVSDFLIPDPEGDIESDMQFQKGGFKYQLEVTKPVNQSRLIVGALESSFREMDKRIGEDKENFKVKGGCTALLVLFILGKVYTACAGDSRAIVVVDNQIEPLSRDHTPNSERMRICHLGHQYPFLLSDEYTSNEFHKRPTISDLGKNVLCRSPDGCGYLYRPANLDDLKMPLISGMGKRARLMGTIGVTRGFGDHELKALRSSLAIKPFLSHVPEIRILDVMQLRTTNSDVIIMGSDGLFDVTSNKEAVDVVRNFLEEADKISDDRKYLCAAQDLVNYARGKPTPNGSWKKKNGEPASGDDITAWVIPIKPYQNEHYQWVSNMLAKEVNIQCSEYDKLPILTAEECLIGDGEEGSLIDNNIFFFKE